MPLTTTTAGGVTAGLPSGQGGETISSQEDEEFGGDMPGTMVEDVNDADAIIEEHRDRSQHAKKHRRQLLSPPAASGSGVNVAGVGVQDIRNPDKEFLKTED